MGRKVEPGSLVCVCGASVCASACVLCACHCVNCVYMYECSYNCQYVHAATVGEGHCMSSVRNVPGRECHILNRRSKLCNNFIACRYFSVPLTASTRNSFVRETNSFSIGQVVKTLPKSRE